MKALFMIVCSDVAQLDRAWDFYSQGCGFDSRHPSQMVCFEAIGKMSGMRKK